MLSRIEYDDISTLRIVDWLLLCMQRDEVSLHKKLRTEVIQLEDTLAQVRKEYEMLRIEFEQTLAANEQAGTSSVAPPTVCLLHMPSLKDTVWSPLVVTGVEKILKNLKSNLIHFGLQPGCLFFTSDWPVLFSSSGKESSFW